MQKARKFIDIGVNFTDLMYHGVYHDNKIHEPDLIMVIDRAINAGVEKMIITGSDLHDSKHATKLAKQRSMLFSTVGCHPTRCDDIELSGDANTYIQSLCETALEHKDMVVAIGEIGLDYDRLQFCSKDVQIRNFKKQLNLSPVVNLPLFLHCRNASEDFLEILSKHENTCGGVVHSFDGDLETANKLIQLGYSIGINGCSLKTESNLETVKQIPITSLMIETDSPWCGVRNTHAGSKYIKTKFQSVKKEKWSPTSMVKGRNEPCTIVQILEILSAIREEDEEILCNQLYENTEKLFFNKLG